MIINYLKPLPKYLYTHALSLCRSIPLRLVLVILSALIIGIITLIITLVRCSPHSLLTFSMLDVGQGDALLIQTPRGQVIMIDGGPDTRVYDLVRKQLPLSSEDIDLMIVTHPDKDHIAGLLVLFDRYRIHHILTTEKVSTSLVFKNLEERILQEKGIEHHYARRGQRIILDATYGVFLDILFPDQDTSTFTDTNEASIVMQLTYGTCRMLLMGDAPTEVEEYLTSYDTSLIKGSILKLGHHGSKTSSSDHFLQEILPSLGLISAGKNNSYHHPHEEVLRRFETYHIPLRSTLDDGTVTLTCDGKSFW